MRATIGLYIADMALLMLSINRYWGTFVIIDPLALYEVHVGYTKLSDQLASDRIDEMARGVVIHIFMAGCLYPMEKAEYFTASTRKLDNNLLLFMLFIATY